MDMNVVLPPQRLDELVQEGIIGSVADDFYAFMGAMFDVEPMVNETGPDLGRRMKALMDAFHLELENLRVGIDMPVNAVGLDQLGKAGKSLVQHGGPP